VKVNEHDPNFAALKRVLSGEVPFVVIQEANGPGWPEVRVTGKVACSACSAKALFP